MRERYEVRDGSKRFTSNVAPDLSNVNTQSMRLAGKGDERRPVQAADADVAARWCVTFGHKPRYGFCLNCGRSEA